MTALCCAHHAPLCDVWACCNACLSMTPADIEDKVRDMMYPCLDDREVAWQVAHCIEVGRVEYFAHTGRPSLRTEGPATLEVHERDERIARERPEFERQIRDFVLAEFRRAP